MYTRYYLVVVTLYLIFYIIIFDIIKCKDIFDPNCALKYTIAISSGLHNIFLELLQIVTSGKTEHPYAAGWCRVW